MVDYFASMQQQIADIRQQVAAMAQQCQRFSSGSTVSRKPKRLEGHSPAFQALATRFKPWLFTMRPCNVRGADGMNFRMPLVDGPVLTLVAESGDMVKAIYSKYGRVATCICSLSSEVDLERLERFMAARLRSFKFLMWLGVAVYSAILFGVLAFAYGRVLNLWG